MFVLRLGLADSDGDGMEDDWEMAFFNTLAHDCTGNIDGDGRLDLQEFRAATDPTNLGSVLRVMTLASLGGDMTVLWTAPPGQSDQVQFKNSLNDAEWTVVPGSFVLSGGTASLPDPASGAQSPRFYRVVTVP